MGIDLNYSSYPNLKGAELYRATSKNGKYTKVKTFKKKADNHAGWYEEYYSYTNTKLSPGEYFYKVRNYAKIKGKKVYSKFSSVESIIVPKKVEITMDNWMQYYELSPLDCELHVDKNSFGEVTDSYIDYWKDFTIKIKSIISMIAMMKSPVSLSSWNIPKITENVPLTGTPEK